MNEKQKLESGQVHPSDKKSEKDYSKYFEVAYIPPSLKDAKNEARKPLLIIMTLKFLNNLKDWETEESSISVRTAAK